MIPDHNQRDDLDVLFKMREALLPFDYPELFLRKDGKNLDIFWKGPDGPKYLKTLALDRAFSVKVNFLAAEILFRRDPGFPSAKEKVLLAEVYALALGENLTRMANPWGFPGELSGPAGEHFVKLGDTAIEPLSRLLDDQRMMVYGGSGKAASANRQKYRICDCAAFFICRIKHCDFELCEGILARDVLIQGLKKKLSSLCDSHSYNE